jgi:tetratricopeptide (TPR) repeat protein
VRKGARLALRVAAIVSVPVAIALVVLAADVLRTPGVVGGEDTAFAGAPLLQRDAWQDVGFLPGRVTTDLLGLEDDLAYRRLIALYTRIDPRRFEGTTPEREALRGAAIREISVERRKQPDRRLRAQLLNLHGALTMGRSTSDPSERDANLKEAISAFQTALALDPDHADAKYNLELALRAREPGQLAGDNPDRGAARGQRSGTGRAGSGY